MVLNLYQTPAFARGKGPSGPTQVIIAPVTLKDYSDTIEALGTTKSNEMVVIKTDTSEKILEIHFEDGQEVKQGDLLITLTKAEEDADLRAAEASLLEADSAYQRAKKLQKNNALSTKVLQERLTILQQRKANIETIKARLDKHIITAPFDGVLGLREVSIGTLLQPNDPITTIDDITKIKVDFDVPSTYLSSLTKGASFAGKVEAFPNQEFKGKIQAINTRIDPVTRTVKTRGIINNPNKILKPGLLMSIDIIKNQRQAIVIPEESLIKRSDKNFVFITDKKEGKLFAKEIEVTIGTRKPGEIEILSGLNAGDNIIVHGIVKIKDNSEIKIKAIEDKDMSLQELIKQEQDNKKDKGDQE